MQNTLFGAFEEQSRQTSRVPRASGTYKISGVETMIAESLAVTDSARVYGPSQTGAETQASSSAGASAIRQR